MWSTPQATSWFAMKALLPINDGIAMFVSGCVHFIKVLLASMCNRPGSKVVSQLSVTIFHKVVKQQNHVTLWEIFGFQIFNYYANDHLNFS
jgi:hypothetical protein